MVYRGPRSGVRLGSHNVISTSFRGIDTVYASADLFPLELLLIRGGACGARGRGTSGIALNDMEAPLAFFFPVGVRVAQPKFGRYDT
jgi:hypothetical protein